MKKIIVIFALSFMLLSLFGCRDNQQIFTETKNGNISIVDNNFPDFVVGTWKVVEGDKTRWIFTFESDGTISKFRHFAGMDFTVADGTFAEPWRGGGKAVYNLGPCTAEYDSKTRHLAVTIIIKHYEITFPNGSMEGTFCDYLGGYISEDGQVWKADWMNQSEIFGSGKDEFDEPKRIMFEKVTEDIYSLN